MTPLSIVDGPHNAQESCVWQARWSPGNQGLFTADPEDAFIPWSQPSPSPHGRLYWKVLLSRHLPAWCGCQKGRTGNMNTTAGDCKSTYKHGGLPVFQEESQTVGNARQTDEKHTCVCLEQVLWPWELYFCVSVNLTSACGADCVRHYSKCLTNINSFNPPNNPV